MEPAIQEQRRAAIMAPGTNARLRILLAEDTPISAEAMKAMAHRFAVEMHVASNGLDAIDMIDAAAASGQPYSLLLVDVMMPVLGGIETVKRLRARGYDAGSLPIIAVTAATSLDEVRSYLACGMQAFLTKPVSLKDFRAMLDAWVNHAEKSNNNAPKKIEPALLKALTQQFHDRNKRTLNLIEDALKNGDFGSETMQEIKHLLHQIAGTAATFGEAKLSEAARRHESALDAEQTDRDRLRNQLDAAATSMRQRIKG